MESRVDLPSPEPIEVSLWSRWLDQKGRLFVVVDKRGPQSCTGRQEVRLTVLEVDREYTHVTTRPNFEHSVRSGQLTRITDQLNA